MLNTINFNSKNIIVGSQCGGFDFYSQKQGSDQFIWLGANKTSDFDIYSDIPIKKDGVKIERKQLKHFKECWTGKKNLWLGYKFPYKINGKLYIPEDKSYLCWTIAKRLQLQSSKKITMTGTPFDIYNQNKNYLFTIKFVPICPIIYKIKQMKQSYHYANKNVHGFNGLFVV